MSESVSNAPGFSGGLSGLALVNELERTTGERHELIRGVPVLMTGASRRHNRVASRSFRALDDFASAQDCETFIEGTRVSLSNDTYVFPDVVVTCEGPTDDYVVSSPCCIVEVLSPSTSWIDHGSKRGMYLTLPSMRHYILVNVVSESVEHYFRTSPDETWRFEIGKDSITLNCPQGVLDVPSLFAG